MEALPRATKPTRLLEAIYPFIAQLFALSAATGTQAEDVCQTQYRRPAVLDSETG